MYSFILSFLVLMNNKYISICLLPFILVFNVYLIFNFNSDDLTVYTGQIRDNVFYQKEFLFGFIQFISSELFLHAEDSIDFLQCMFLMFLMFLLFSSYKWSANFTWIFLLLPVFFLGEFNSLRQGFSALFLLAGIQVDRLWLRWLFFIMAPFFHLSAIFGVFVYISIFNYNSKLFIKLMLISIVFIVCAYLFRDILSVVDKTDYIREESFTSSRYDGDIKILYLFIIGVVLFFNLNMRDVQTLGFIYILMSFLMVILPADDLVFRLSYYLQCFMVYFFCSRSSCLNLRCALAILFLNPSIFSLLSSGSFN